MSKKEIIIRVGNDGVFINPRLFIPIQQTNIPKKHLTFRSSEDIFWNVELLGYKEEIECLKVSVKEYKQKNIIGFDKQEPTKKVTKIYFDKFDWIKLEPLLIYYHKKELIEYLSYSKKDSKENYNNDFHANNEKLLSKPSITTMSENFGVYFTECNFMLGYVAFKKYIKKIGKEVDFKIPNEHILAEFDNIKYWFAKKLKTKKFKVIVTIKIRDNEITETKATSDIINQITPELIDSVKFQRTFALTKEPRLSKPDKSLFTADEIFTQFNSDDIEGNVFKQSEKDILNFFINEKAVRNKKQLAYLAGKKQSDNYRLRYTLNPNFGFLFLIEGSENNHFVWELLNSNATYIWSIEKGKQNIELQFKRIEDIVNNVRRSGRENYKRAYINNHHDNDLIFRVLNHKNIGSKLIDDFPDWKNRLNEQLT